MCCVCAALAVSWWLGGVCMSECVYVWCIWAWMWACVRLLVRVLMCACVRVCVHVCPLPADGRLCG